VKSNDSELPDGWTLCKLGFLLREVDVRVADLPESQRTIEVLSLTKRFGLVPQTERFERRVATENVDRYKVVRRGWIVYNPYVIWEGAIHALRRETPGIVSPVYAVWERTEEDFGFLDLKLRTPELIASYEKLSAGAVNRRRSIKKNDFLNIEVAIPRLPEQQKIACVVRLAERVAERCERLLALMLELKKSVLHRLFTTGLNNKAPKQTELGQLPEDWNVAPLGNYLTEAQYGLSRKGAKAGSYPLLRMTNQHKCNATAWIPHSCAEARRAG